jgi:hypothetical protein
MLTPLSFLLIVALGKKVVIARTPVNSEDLFLRHKTTHRKVYSEKLEEASTDNAIGLT